MAFPHEPDGHDVASDALGIPSKAAHPNLSNAIAHQTLPRSVQRQAARVFATLDRFESQLRRLERELRIDSNS